MLDVRGNIISADLGILKDLSGHDTTRVLEDVDFIVSSPYLFDLYDTIGRFVCKSDQFITDIAGKFRFAIISFQHAMISCYPIPDLSDNNRQVGYLISLTYPYELFNYDLAQKTINELMQSQQQTDNTPQELSKEEKAVCQKTGKSILEEDSMIPRRLIDPFLFRSNSKDTQKEYLRDRFDDIYFFENKGIDDYAVVKMTTEREEPDFILFVGGPTITEPGLDGDAPGDMLIDEYSYLTSDEMSKLYSQARTTKLRLNHQLDERRATHYHQKYGQFRSVVLNFDRHVIAVHPADEKSLC